MSSISLKPGDSHYGPTSRAFTLARIQLGVMLIWAPLPFGAVYTWAWASITIMTLLVLFLWMVGSVRSGGLRIGYTSLYIPIGFFLAMGLVQLVFHLTLTPEATKESLLKLATYSVLFFVVIQLFADSPSQTWSRVGFAVLMFGFIFSCLSILQFLWNPARILWVQHDLATPFGPYVDHDHYAGLMEMIIPISATYVLSRPKHDPLNGILWFGVLVPVVSLLLTGSRGGFVAVLIESGILAWVVIWRNPLPGRRMRVFVTGLALAAVAAVFFWLVPNYVMNRLGTVNNYVSETSRGFRPNLWKSSFGIYWDHPLFGTGMGSFATAFPPHQLEVSDLVTEHAHNDYVEALAETGLLGGILILAIAALFLVITFKSLHIQLKRDPGWIQLGAGISCCGLMVHSFVDFNLHIPANAAWFALCAGLATLSGRAIPRRSGKLPGG